MTRSKGVRNAGYAQRRGEIIARIRERLKQPDATRASWRELAAAAGVSLSTLSHYFGRRDDVVRAVMENDLAGAVEPLATMARPTGRFEQSVADAVEHLADGFRHGGLGQTFATGLIEGLLHSTLGPVFLATALEPSLRAAEARLQHHIDAGEMRGGDPRGAAIMLIAPVVVSFLHQQQLGGEKVRALEIDRFLESHAEAFVRAWRS